MYRKDAAASKRQFKGNSAARKVGGGGGAENFFDFYPVADVAFKTNVAGVRVVGRGCISGRPLNVKFIISIKLVAYLRIL